MCIRDRFNTLLKRWSERFGDALQLDHVTLRRYLVDEYYIYRDEAGTMYEIDPELAPYSFDEAILGLDLDEIVTAELERRAIRRKKHGKQSIDSGVDTGSL